MDATPETMQIPVYPGSAWWFRVIYYICFETHIFAQIKYCRIRILRKRHDEIVHILEPEPKRKKSGIANKFSVSFIVINVHY